MRVLDLFSGIGGFSLGLEAAGMRTVQFVEIDPFCRAVLAKHWPQVPCHDNIRTFQMYYGDVDVICGGPPCQPASRAGKQQGTADDRWLWPETIRIVSAVRPRWILFENPLGLYDVGIATVLSPLETLGYANTSMGTIEPFEIPACALGSWHRRDRIWILAYDATVQRQEIVWGESNGALSKNGLTADLASSRWSTNVQHEQETARDTTARQSFGSFPAIARQWSAEPGVVRVVHGIPNRVDRIAALGNAVVPQIVEILGRSIMMAAW